MSISSKPQIIGLSGTFASGKDTLAHYLSENYNYLHVSQGDILRRIAQEKYGSIERPTLHKLADELRHTEGADYLTRLIIQEYHDKIAAGERYSGLIISGMRSLGEAKAIHKARGVIVFTDAPVEVRYQRMISRQRDTEAKLTLEQFKAQEATELQSVSSDDASFNVLGIRDMADVVINNQTDQQTFVRQSIEALHII